MGQANEQERARWRGLLAEQKESGHSVVVFCREHGLREWQFYEWKKRLHPKAEPFVAVKVVSAEPAPVTAAREPEACAPLEIRLRSGRSVLVGPDFEASHLERLLQVLEPEA
jgi:Transposase